jgi:hypothetical protein
LDVEWNQCLFKDRIIGLAGDPGDWQFPVSLRYVPFPEVKPSANEFRSVINGYLDPKLTELATMPLRNTATPSAHDNMGGAQNKAARYSTKPSEQKGLDISEVTWSRSAIFLEGYSDPVLKRHASNIRDQGLQRNCEQRP